MTDKKKTLFRVLIFTVLAYLPVIILRITVIDDLSDASSLVSLGIMFSPALANILTRIITGEGMRNSYLTPNILSKKWYYIIGIAVPLLFGVLATLTSAVLIDNAGSIHTPFTVDNVTAILSLISNSVAVVYICFGEEFGWRAYLTPKLEELMPEPAALAVSGIIWGMWHAPLISLGFNFGTDYKFFPWGGYGIMCIFCIMIGSFLSWLTKKSNSVFPAALCHTLTDTLISSVVLMLLPDGVMAISTEPFKACISVMLPQIVFGMVFFAVLSVKRKNNEKT